MSVTPISLPALEADSQEVTNAKIESLALFQGLPGKVMATIFGSADVRDYTAGQTIYALGQYDGSELFVVLSGVVRVSVLDPVSGSMYIDEFNENGIFGIESALRGEVDEAAQRLSVTAQENTTVASIDADMFRKLASQRPSLMRNIALHFAAEITSVRYKAMSVEAAPEQRVFAALLELVKRDGVVGEWRIAQMPKHREIAEQTGVDETEAANAIASLIQDGVATRDYPGLVIQDMQRFNQLAR